MLPVGFPIGTTWAQWDDRGLGDRRRQCLAVTDCLWEAEACGDSDSGPRKDDKQILKPAQKLVMTSFFESSFLSVVAP